jgi:hypothetical protein
MNVKGTAFLARKLLLEHEFGEADAKRMLDEAVAAVPTFPKLVLASTSIPMGPFLALQDEILRRYFAGDPQSFFHFGELSADWALVKGPYKSLAAKDIDSFISQGLAIYRTYFDVGNASTVLRDGLVEYRITGIPKEFRHVYVEYATVGYFKRGLEILGAINTDVKRVHGFSIGSEDVFYEIHFRRGPVSSKSRIAKAT